MNIKKKQIKPKNVQTALTQNSENRENETLKKVSFKLNFLIFLKSC